MPKYIDREALYQKIHESGGCDAPKNSWADGWDKGITEAIRLLNEQPTADVVEVRHGEWKKIRYLEGCVNRYQHTCNVCGKSYFDNNANFNYPYCPNCGADMRGKTNGEK